MENGVYTQLQLTCETGAAYLVYLYRVAISPQAFMSKSGVVHMLLHPSMVLLPAHHEMVSYCSLAKTDSHMKASFWLCETTVM